MNRPFQGAMDQIRRYGSSRLIPQWEAQEAAAAREEARRQAWRQAANPWAPRGYNLGSNSTWGLKEWGGIGAVGVAGSLPGIIAGRPSAKKAKIDTKGRPVIDSSMFGKKVDKDRQAIYDRWKKANDQRKAMYPSERRPRGGPGRDTETDGRSSGGYKSGGGSRKIADYKVFYDYS